MANCNMSGAHLIGKTQEMPAARQEKAEGQRSVEDGAAELLK